MPAQQSKSIIQFWVTIFPEKIDTFFEGEPVDSTQLVYFFPATKIPV